MDIKPKGVLRSLDSSGVFSKWADAVVFRILQQCKVQSRERQRQRRGRSMTLVGRKTRSNSCHPHASLLYNPQGTTVCGVLALKPKCV